MSGFVHSAVRMTVDLDTQQLSAYTTTLVSLEQIRWGSSVYTIPEPEGLLWTIFTQWILGLDDRLSCLWFKDVSRINNCSRPLFHSKDRRTFGAQLEQHFQSFLKQILYYLWRRNFLVFLCYLKFKLKPSKLKEFWAVCMAITKVITSTAQQQIIMSYVFWWSKNIRSVRDHVHLCDETWEDSTKKC